MDLAEDNRFKSRDDRRHNFQELHDELAKSFATNSRDEWLKRLEENDVPSAPLYNMAEVLADPQVKHLGLLEEVEHPKAGKLRFVRSAVNHEGLPEKKPSPPPLLGEHTGVVLAQLGYGQDTIRELENEGVVLTQK